MNETLLKHLNHVLSNWKEQFDVTNAVDIAFTQNDKGWLCLNDLALHQAETLTLEASDYDAESINFVFARDRTISISIVWPEDEPPRLHSVRVEFAYID